MPGCTTGNEPAEHGALERTRTSDLQVRNLLLYPLSYERSKAKVYRTGRMAPRIWPILTPIMAPNLDRLTLGRLLRQSCERFRDRPAMYPWSRDGYRPMTYGDLADTVRRYASAVRALGLERGDRLVILSENCADWAWTDWACQTLGVVVVPIYPTLPADQVEYIVRDSGAKVVAIGSEEQAPKVKGLDGIRVIRLQRSEAGESLEELSRSAPEMTESEWKASIDTAREDDLATLIYTSGTTGLPKGAMLTQRSMTWIVDAIRKELPIDENDTFFTFLPMSHVYERVAGQVLPIACGSAIAYAGSLRTLADDVRKVRPTIMLCVPRFLDSVRTKILEAISKSPPIRQKLFALAYRQGLNHARGKAAPLFGLTDKLVGAKIRERLGGRLRFVVSGGAALPLFVADFYDAFGIPVLQGYGLTETSAVVSVNRPGHARPETIGPPISGVDVKIAEDGEILVKAPCVMKGYFGLAEETAAAIDAEGWFHTGDIGAWDNGHLKITDRKKDLLVLGNGKNVAPQPIENKLKESRFIAEAVLFGDGQEYCSALIVPEFDAVKAWGQANGHAFTDEDAIVRSDAVRALIKKEIDGINAGLADFERVKKHALLSRPFSEATGELTPTMKVKRRVVREKYRDLIDSLN